MSVLLNNICFAYPDTPYEPVLNIKHWSVNTSECVFLHGPSGSGKSTLLNVLGGILTVNQGEISILGQRLDQMSPHQKDKFRACHIGYVFQQFNLIPYLNAIDNIRLAAHFARSSRSNSELVSTIETTLLTLNIEQSQWCKPAAQLSIGQQQRVAICRALINQPELLIVDEPTSSLDKKNRDDFMALLMSLVENYKTTLIFVSHDIELSHFFSRVDAVAEINCAEGSL